MYAKCRSMSNAQQVFDNIKQPDVVSWSSLILGYAENGKGLKALDLFARMKDEGCPPNQATFLAALKACTSLVRKDGTGRAECLERGKHIHSMVSHSNAIHVQNTLMDMYSKCGKMLEARLVFDSIKDPSVVSWNVLILGYAENGEGDTALDLFERMTVEPNHKTFIAALKACICFAGKAEYFEKARQVHSCIADNSDIYLQNTLIDMYCKFGNMVQARNIFDNINNPNAISWTVLITGYAENGDGATALDMFERMKAQGCRPDSITFLAAVKACISLASSQDGAERSACLARGKQIHSEIGFISDAYLQNTLIDMYAKCGSMAEARQVFNCLKKPTVVSWTNLIFGYVENGQGSLALDLFSRMKSEGYLPSSVTFVAALRACTSLIKQEGSIDCRQRGKEIHEEIGTQSNIYVQNTLVDMYSKCGSMVEAHQVFDNVNLPDVVSWNALIQGYAENGYGAVALDLFSRMKSQLCIPNSVTYVAALKACALLGALEPGRKIHAEISAGVQSSAILVTSLVDFYAKSGSVIEAQNVFDSYPNTRDLTTWTALLAGYSLLGDNKAVFELLEGMQGAGLQPDGITLLCILTCCSHSGLVEKAKECFEAMPRKHGIFCKLEHYNCMVDILGRSNRLDDALALLRNMPLRPNAVTWMTVLDACDKWKNVGIGRLAFKYLVRLGDRHTTAYLVMAHIYASRGMWEEHKILMGILKA